MRTLATLASLALCAPALAADHEIGFELGSLGNTDPAYNAFSNGDDMPSRGLRVGFAFHDRVAAVAGWHHVRRGAELYDGRDTALWSAFLADEFTLGLKADLPIGDYVAPYAIAQGMLFRGVARFDDDPTDAESIGQVSEAGLAPGFTAAGGVELHVLPDTWGPPLGFGVHLEVGYGYVGKLQLADLGDMKPGGVMARAGLSVLF